MANRSDILILAVLMTVSAISCTVVEDRESCPCYLDVDYTDIKAEHNMLRLKVGTELFLNGGFFCETGSGVSGVADTVTLKVSRNVYDAFTSLSCGTLYRDGTVLRTREGCCYDSLYAATESVDCRGDTAYMLPGPRKQFITVRVTDNDGGRAFAGYDLVMKGDVNGLDIRDLSPANGPFEAALTPNPGGDTLSVRIPRFAGDGFTVGLSSRNVTGRGYSILLGEAMRSVGYDFSADNLSDVLITLDFSNMSGLIRIVGWDEEKIVTMI